MSQISGEKPWNIHKSPLYATFIHYRATESGMQVLLSTIFII